MEITSILNQSSIIIASLILIFGWGVLYRKDIFSFAKNWDEQKVKALATGVGMFFTFVGIVIGLMTFDTNNLSESVPQLLGGLKTAFMTSVAGLLVSLIATYKEKASSQEILASGSGGDASIEGRILLELQKLNKNIIGEGEASLNTVISKLRQDTVDSFSVLNENTKNSFESLGRSITGDGESSLSTSLMRLRQDNSDNFKSLSTSFDDFAKEMANNNINALTEAIEKVMGEFNEVINNQLGETFDNFRKSVEELNNWQQAYKSQVDGYIQDIQNTKDSIKNMESSIDSMKSSYEAIKEISQKFDTLIEDLKNHMEGSLELSESISSISQDLEGSGKLIKDEIRDMFDGTKEEMENTMKETLTLFGENLAAISQKMASDFQKVQEALSATKN